MPNVGKSSLLNRLAGEERAIVTDYAGTTRDVLREIIQIEGIPLHIIDTAGLRETDDPVEQAGITRAWQALERADVILQLVDARAGVTPGDRAIAARLPARIERVVVENKSDLAGLPVRRFVVDGRVHLVLSARSGEGVDLLRDELLRVAGWSGHGEDVVLARERHIEALGRAAEKSALAERQLGQVDLCAEELRLAQLALASITGEFTADDLLGEIFSRFCIGK
jgi:tRNA modification GTPase